jgi:predicted permease
VVAAILTPAGPAYDRDEAARERYFEEALRAAERIPGVRAAGGVDVLPTRGNYGLSYFIEGYEPRAGEPQPSDQIRRAMPGYFATMRQRVLAGREFVAGDDAKAPLVALVNESWVRRYFPGKDVLGQRIRLDSKQGGEWRTIVGVVADARERGLDKPVLPVYYFAAAQLPPEQMAIVVRGQVTAGTLWDALSRADPAQPVDRVWTLEQLMAASLAPRRFPLQLLAVFAALALLLSAVGIYGVTSYAVAQRTREIGVRMAIGASAATVLRMILAGALRTVGMGVCIGIAGALAAGRLIASQLYAVSPSDPATYAAIALLLALVAVAASAIPALRAARIDPMAALRNE